MTELIAAEGVLRAGEHWYRYVSVVHEPFICLIQLPVVNHTEKGVWLDDYGKKRFCLNDARKRYAYPTLELARESFIIRQQKRLGWLAHYKATAQASLNAANEGFWPEKNNFPYYQDFDFACEKS